MASLTRWKFGGTMEPILHSFAYSLDYLRDQIADVPDELMAVQPDGVPNHAVWTIGHLVFIAQEIGGVIGIEPWLGEDWASQFGPGSEPSMLGAMTRCELLAALETAQAKITATVGSLTDSDLEAPFPDPTYAHVFPSVRHALTQVLLGHTAFHIGQLSVWRRAMNFPTLNRSYE